MSKFSLILMTSIHCKLMPRHELNIADQEKVGCMTLAFFFVYPTILVFSSIIVLCELIERPELKTRIEKWQIVFHVVFFLPLVVIGMVCGVVGMGLSDHFRTEHKVSGALQLQ